MSEDCTISGVKLLKVSGAAIWSHGDIQAWSATNGPMWICGHMEARVLSCVHGSSCYQRLCNCIKSDQSPGTRVVLIWVISAPTRAVVVHGPELPRVMSGSVIRLQLGSVVMSKTHVKAGVIRAMLC